MSPADIFGARNKIGRRIDGASLEIRLGDPPPSSNNMFANVPGKGRIKSKLYNLWIESAGWEARTQSVNRVGGSVLIDITVFRMSKIADIDNRVKACIDLLVAHDLIDDDKNVQEIRARWSNERGCKIVVSRIQDSAVAA